MRGGTKAHLVDKGQHSNHPALLVRLINNALEVQVPTDSHNPSFTRGPLLDPLPIPLLYSLSVSS